MLGNLFGQFNSSSFFGQPSSISIRIFSLIIFFFKFLIFICNIALGQSTGGMFGNTQQPNSQSGLFGQTNSMAANNPLNGANVSFGSTGTGGSLFGSQQPTQTGISSGLFGGGKPAQSGGMFGNPQQGSIFGSNFIIKFQ